jgi:biopolymer transport protein ExbD
MVDVIFLMLLFLMVGADMGQRELEEVRLPVASTVKPVDPAGDLSSDALTVNVYHDTPGGAVCRDYDDASLCPRREHWSIGIKGTDYRSGQESELRAYLRRAAGEHRAREGEAPELRVLIRADRAALYELVQRAMNACGDAGIYKLEVGAASPLE